jgi:hypothetical protein
LGSQGELVLLLTADAELAAQVLGRLHYPARHRVQPPSGGDPGAREPVHQLHTVSTNPASQPKDVVLGRAHRLHSASHDETRGATVDLHRGVQPGLQARPASSVDLWPWH